MPRVQTRGSIDRKIIEIRSSLERDTQGARENGRQREIYELSPAVAGFDPYLIAYPGACAPRLYAYACFAG